jgi:hypothetical protein
MFARIPIAFVQPFDEALGAVPGVTLLGFHAFERAELVFSVGRDLCRPFQQFAVVTSFGLGVLQLMQLVLMPGRQSCQLLQLGSFRPGPHFRTDDSWYRLAQHCLREQPGLGGRFPVGAVSRWTW